MNPFFVIWIHRILFRFAPGLAAFGVFLASWGLVAIHVDSIICLKSYAQTEEGNASFSDDRKLQEFHKTVLSQLKQHAEPISEFGRLGREFLDIAWSVAVSGSILLIFPAVWFLVRMIQWIRFKRLGSIAVRRLRTSRTTSKENSQDLRRLPVLPGLVWLDQRILPEAVIEMTRLEMPDEDLDALLDKKVQDVFTNLFGRLQDSWTCELMIGKARVVVAKQRSKNGSLMPTYRQLHFYTLVKQMPFGGQVFALLFAERKGNSIWIGNVVVASQRQFMTGSLLVREIVKKDCAEPLLGHGLIERVPMSVIVLLGIVASAIPFFNIIALLKTFEVAFRHPYAPCLLPAPWRQILGNAQELHAVTGNEGFSTFESAFQAALSEELRS